MSPPREDSTQDVAEEGGPRGTSGLAREPGAVLVYDSTNPACVVIPLGETAIELGRGHAALGAHEDPAMSRHHARLAYQKGCFRVADLGGRNGSALDGKPLRGEVTSSAARLVRLGNSLLLLCHDARLYRTRGVKADGPRIEGPALQQLMQKVAGLAMLGRTLLVLGESGTGKESIARAFHARGPRPGGPFVAVNCATLPVGVAERLLFGAQKGAYSGAVADSQGYLAAASGGTLFLDELGELELGVQAKLLRVLETGEVTPLGSTRAQKVDLRICCATHRPLRELAAKGTFRADLYFRLSTPQVDLPALRQRPEEIPWHIVQQLREVDPELRPQASLVETCLLRAWPGNVRELLLSIRAAGFNARMDGCDTVGPQHLQAQAGVALGAGEELSADGRAVPDMRPPEVDVAGAERPSPGPAPPAEEDGGTPVPARTEVMAAIVRADGNVSAAARELGLQRTQLRRLLARYQIDLQKLRDLP